MISASMGMSFLDLLEQEAQMNMSHTLKLSGFFVYFMAEVFLLNIGCWTHAFYLLETQVQYNGH